MTPDPSDLIANRLISDQRVKQAKQLLKEALHDAQDQIHGIQPAQEDKIASYEEMIESISIGRGGNLYYPYLGSGIGKGPFVELLDGSIKYDLINGIGVHLFGHSHPLYLESGVDAALSDTIMQGNLQQNGDSLELIELLLKHSGFDHCFLTSSGVMANENALKLVFQKHSPATRVLAFDHNFMGRTLAVSGITDKPLYREGLPTFMHVDYVPFYDADRPKESIQEALHALETHLKRYPGQHAAMIFELVQGEGGFYYGSKEFYVALMELLKKHNVAIIADEVQSFGRTKELFAFQMFDLMDYVDIVNIGKLSQVCATLFKKDYVPKPGLLSQTFTSSTSAIRASIAILKELTNGTYYGKEGKNTILHDQLRTRFQTLEDLYPGMIRGPYGIGAMFAFTVFDGSPAETQEFAKRLYDAGIVSFVAGGNPMRIRFLLPTPILEESHMDEIISIVEQTLAKGPSEQAKGPWIKLRNFWSVDQDG